MSQIDVKDAVRLIWLAAEGRLDEEAIRCTLGSAEAGSMSQIAQGFSVSAATVRHTWKPNGMPSVGKRGSGSKAIWAEVLIWALRRSKTNEVARGVDNFTARKREAETRAVEAEATIKEHKAQVTVGEYVKLVVAVSVVKGYANKLRDGLMGLSRQLSPLFPAKYATQWTEDIERLHRNLLTAFSESSINDLREAANERTDSDV